jgi:D-glycero-D-manno-heptose 1,7-bisphosphate phosphatase
MTVEQVRVGQHHPFFTPLNLPLNPLLTTGQPTIFVDRDGVINQNRTDHVLAWKDFHFLEGSLEALALLNEAGYQVIVVTNQAAITRKLISVAELDFIHQQMCNVIEAHGGFVKNIFYCHHLPTEGCNCRKPKPGLLLQAARNYNINLADSWLVGDHLTDVQAATAAGAKPVLVLTGRGQSAYESWLTTRQSAAPDTTQPLPVKANLLEAVEFILAHARIGV